MDQTPETIVTELETFDSTLMMPGFGVDAVAAGRAVEHAIANAKDLGLHLKEVVVARGQLVLRGEAEPGKLKAGVEAIAKAVHAIHRAKNGNAPSALPRSAEERS